MFIIFVRWRLSVGIKRFTYLLSYLLTYLYAKNHFLRFNGMWNIRSISKVIQKIIQYQIYEQIATVCLCSLQWEPGMHDWRTGRTRNAHLPATLWSSVPVSSFLYYWCECSWQWLVIGHIDRHLFRFNLVLRGSEECFGI